MEIISSYAVRIMSTEFMGALKDTTQIYRSALAYLIDFYYPRWDEIQAAGDANERHNYAEGLVHTAKKKTAVCDFDQKFYKMPSYFRRACIRDALGCIGSYVSNYQNWVDGGKAGAEPALQCDRYAAPSFYHGNMYDAGTDDGWIFLKLFYRKDWVWVRVRVRKTDLNYIARRMGDVKPSAPTLEKRHGKYYLRFAFTESVDLNTTWIWGQRICAVDLGLNKDAVCSILDASGTVLARKFINFAGDKDRMYRVLGRIKKLQRRYGSKNGSVKNTWAYARRLNDELAKAISAAIVKFAAEWNADVIVFEYLDTKRKKYGSRKQRLALWKKDAIQDYVEHKAHLLGMHISRICAWKTSKLAYDGSGEIFRGRKNLSEEERQELLVLHAAKKPLPKDGRPETYTNKETCTFTTGKEYNCDLSASYNIGARYFVRGILNILDDDTKKAVFAKVPDAEHTTTRTLSTLRALNKTLGQPGGATQAA